MQNIETTFTEGDNIIKEYATFDPEREEQNKINAKNAELLFNVPFFPYQIKVQKEHGLSDLETKLFSFIQYYAGGGGEFYASNPKLGQYFGCHKDTISTAVGVLAKKGLVITGIKVLGNGNSVRKLSVGVNAEGGRYKHLGGSVKTPRVIGEKTDIYKLKEIKVNTSPIGDTGKAPKETKEIQKKQEYGKPEINQMLSALKAKIGVEAFADSGIERNIAQHCINLMGRIGVKEFSRRLDLILDDAFKHKNCNRIRFVYSEIKGFIEPVRQTIPSF